jgi:tRNA-splicing ligase RtcB
VREAQRAALQSTVHGAGRVLSRTAAAGKRDRKTGRVLKPGAVTPEMMDAGCAARGVILRGRGARREPAGVPSPARRARGAGRHDRDRAHPAAARRRHGGADEFDPYRD